MGAAEPGVPALMRPRNRRMPCGDNRDIFTDRRIRRPAPARRLPATSWTLICHSRDATFPFDLRAKRTASRRFERTAKRWNRKKKIGEAKQNVSRKLMKGFEVSVYRDEDVKGIFFVAFKRKGQMHVIILPKKGKHFKISVELVTSLFVDI